jgi:hypothetical protein
MRDTRTSVWEVFSSFHRQDDQAKAAQSKNLLCPPGPEISLLKTPDLALEKLISCFRQHQQET